MSLPPFQTFHQYIQRSGSRPRSRLRQCGTIVSMPSVCVNDDRRRRENVPSVLGFSSDANKFDYDTRGNQSVIGGTGIALVYDGENRQKRCTVSAAALLHFHYPFKPRSNSFRDSATASTLAYGSVGSFS